MAFRPHRKIPESVVFDVATRWARGESATQIGKALSLPTQQIRQLVAQKRRHRAIDTRRQSLFHRRLRLVQQALVAELRRSDLSPDLIDELVAYFEEARLEIYVADLEDIIRMTEWRPDDAPDSTVTSLVRARRLRAREGK